jgi:O-antigen/teichoic acid export membrane protein
LTVEARNSLPVDDTAGIDNAKVIARGAGLSMFGVVAYRGLRYLFLVLAARGVGAVGFGYLSLGLAMVNVTSRVALLGLNFGALRYVPRFRAVGDTRGERWLIRGGGLLIAGVGAVVGLGVAALAGHLGGLFGQTSPEMTVVLRWLSPVIGLFALLAFFTAVLDAQKRVELEVLLQQIAQPTLALLLGGAVILLGGGVVGLVQSQLFSMALAVGAAIYIHRSSFSRFFSRLRHPTGVSWGEVLGFSWPFVPMALLRQFSNQLEIYILGLLGKPIQVGVFNAAASTAAFINFGLRAVGNIYATFASELHATDDLEQLAYQLQTSTRWAVTVATPGLVAVILFGSDILRIFNDQFGLGSTALLILSLSQYVNTLCGPVSLTLSMAGYSRLFLINNTAVLILNILLDWQMIPRWGVLGAALGSAISLVVWSLIHLLEVRFLLGIWSYSHHLWRPVLAGLLTCGVGWLAGPLLGTLPFLVRVLCSVSTVGVTYAVAFWFLAPPDDRRIARSVWVRARAFVGISRQR